MRSFLFACAISVAPFAVWAAPAIEVVKQNLQQGGFWLAKVPSASIVTLGGTKVPLVPTPENNKAYALVGFDRFSPAVRWVKVCENTAPASCTTQRLAITKRTYATQNVKGAPKNTLNPNPAENARAAADSVAISKARAVVVASAAETIGFTQTFKKPVLGARISGVYGSQRLFEGEERTWHKGTDFAAPTSTPIYAPADGVVRLARDTFMSGNLIMLDHGAQLSTVYAHLSAMNVKVGDTVKQGDVLGKVGTTGRSSGPHLHLGMYWGAMAIDPALWVK